MNKETIKAISDLAKQIENLQYILDQVSDRSSNDFLRYVDSEDIEALRQKAKADCAARLEKAIEELKKLMQEAQRSDDVPPEPKLNVFHRHTVNAEEYLVPGDVNDDFIKLARRLSYASGVYWVRLRKDFESRYGHFKKIKTKDEL